MGIELDLLQSLLYGFIAAITEFLPISSVAHQSLLLRFFGVTSHDPLLEMVVSLICIACIVVSCRGFFERYKREQHLLARSIRTRGKKTAFKSLLEMRLVKSAAFPMAIILLFAPAFRRFQFNLPVLSLIVVINGIIVYISERMLLGNKDASKMTRLDGLIIGLSGALSVFPGISRTAGVLSASSARGAGRTHAVNWMLYLSIPALAVISIVSAFSLIGGTFALSTGFLGYIFCAIGACFGGFLGIMIIRFLSAHTGYSGFAYYCWGLALFTFIVYLTVV